MTSVSAHGELVHVVIMVESLTAEGITSLVRNSPKLITFLLYLKIGAETVKNVNATLKKAFSKRRLFTAGYCSVTCVGNVKNFTQQNNVTVRVLQDQDTNLLPLCNWP